jgi:hypothetical protein
MNSIALNQLLDELDVAFTPEGKPVVFSIAFVKKNGELVYFPKARKSGVNMDMKKNAMRGIQPTDRYGKPFGHPTPVRIWNIVEFNGKQVKL